MLDGGGVVGSAVVLEVVLETATADEDFGALCKFTFISPMGSLPVTSTPKMRKKDPPLPVLQPADVYGL